MNDDDDNGCEQGPGGQSIKGRLHPHLTTDQVASDRKHTLSPIFLSLIYSIYHLLSFLSILLFSSPHLNRNMTVCLISCVPTQSQHQSQIWQHQVVWMFRARRCSILSLKSGSPARIRASRVLTQDIRIKRLDISIKMCESQKFLMQNNKEDR